MVNGTIKVAPWVVEAFGSRDMVRDRAREAGQVLTDAGFHPGEVGPMVAQLLEDEANALMDAMMLEALHDLGKSISRAQA